MWFPLPCTEYKLERFYQCMELLLKDPHSVLLFFSLTCCTGKCFVHPHSNRIWILTFASAVCSDPGIPSNGNRIGDDFGDGQIVAYMCNVNFTLVGARTVFCLAGQWNATKPTCKGTYTFLLHRVWMCFSGFPLGWIVVIFYGNRLAAVTSGLL